MSLPSVLGLLAFSLVVTMVTSWLVAAFRSRAPAAGMSPANVAANVIWMLLIFATGVIATRYTERVTNVAAGYLVFGCVAFLLSLARAFLYQCAQEQRKSKTKLDRQSLIQNAIHTLTYLLFAIIVYLALSLLAQGPADPILFIPVCIGALLPDLDSRQSLIGRLLPFISRWLETHSRHCQEWHTLGANVAVALVTAPLMSVIGLHAWALIPVGFLSHLVLDMLQPQGIMLFWPLSRTRYLILRRLAESPDGAAKRSLAIALVVVAAILFPLADVRRPPPPPISVPSFESAMERYLSLRGRSLVFADVDGTWQATGRRVSARFEILDAANQSFIMLDRYTDRVFTAGCTSADNLYLNAVNIVAGSPVRVKPVEVQLHDERLAEALPAVYQMQREPGLQHIFVSGEIIVSADRDETGSSLQADYAQTQLRRIQSHGEGRYSLHYLTASALIHLANTSVEIADLVIVASYGDLAIELTATPLPPPPPTPEPQRAEEKATP